MNRTKKIYVVGGDTHYTNWITDYDLTDSIYDADVVLFTGGSDVDPSLYGCNKLEGTYSNLNRDIKEKEEFEKMRHDQLALGICRGLN